MLTRGYGHDRDPASMACIEPTDPDHGTTDDGTDPSAYGTDTFGAKDFVRTGLVLTLVAFALVMLLGATYWHWLGYV